MYFQISVLPGVPFPMGEWYFCRKFTFVVVGFVVVIMIKTKSIFVVPIVIEFLVV